MLFQFTTKIFYLSFHLDNISRKGAKTQYFFYCIAKVRICTQVNKFSVLVDLVNMLI